MPLDRPCTADVIGSQCTAYRQREGCALAAALSARSLRDAIQHVNQAQGAARIDPGAPMRPDTGTRGIVKIA